MVCVRIELVFEHSYILLIEHIHYHIFLTNLEEKRLSVLIYFSIRNKGIFVFEEKYEVFSWKIDGIYDI
mgnify:CR=1 FL=1